MSETAGEVQFEKSWLAGHVAELKKLATCEHDLFSGQFSPSFCKHVESIVYCQLSQTQSVENVVRKQQLHAGSEAAAEIVCENADIQPARAAASALLQMRRDSGTAHPNGAAPAMPGTRLRGGRGKQFHLELLKQASLHAPGS